MQKLSDERLSTSILRDISVLRVGHFEVRDSLNLPCYGLSPKFLPCCILHSGTIPGPVVFGALIDRVCVLWQDSCDGSSCLQYDNRMFGTTALILTMMLRLMSILCFIGALFFYKRSDSERIGTATVEVEADKNQVVEAEDTAR